MNKTKEKDRLRPLLFEGAPDWVNFAAIRNPSVVAESLKNITCLWVWHKNRPVIDELEDFGYLFEDWESGMMMSCKNQPETTLDWKDSLIER